jgi:hypothetical protein
MNYVQSHSSAENDDLSSTKSSGTTITSGVLSEALEVKIREKERQLEESRELIRSLRETINIIVGERDAAIEEARKATRTAQNIFPTSPETPVCSANDVSLQTREFEPTDTPTPGQSHEEAELSELEKALAIASGMLDDLDESDGSQPKRLSFSPASDAISIEHGQRKTDTDALLNEEYRHVLRRVQHLAVGEQLNNSIIEAQRSGATHPSEIKLHFAIPAEVQTAWSKLSPSAVPTYEFADENDGQIDPLKVDVAAADLFMSRRLSINAESRLEGSDRNETVIEDATPQPRFQDSMKLNEATSDPAAAVVSRPIQNHANTYSPQRRGFFGWMLRNIEAISGLAAPARPTHHSAVLIF